MTAPRPGGVAAPQAPAVHLDREPLDPKTANVLYHDAAASTYDRKWAISFDERARSYVTARAERMLPSRHYGRVLEVGCGTGYFLLNLWQCGYVGEPNGCDISPGMLEACGENARRLGCEIGLRTADAERLPYDDGEFDLVLGHAFLHHLPQPAEAIREMFRVLRPGGAVFIAGEPTWLGDRIAAVAKRVAWRGFEAVARVRPALRRSPAPDPATEEERIMRDLEFAVDLHTFEPAEVEAWAVAAGFEHVRTETEELTAAVFGWSMRTVEALFRPELRTDRWGRFVYRNWLRLYQLDQEWLYGVVPKRAFYNVLLHGEKPPPAERNPCE